MGDTKNVCALLTTQRDKNKMWGIFIIKEAEYKGVHKVVYKSDFPSFLGESH